MWKVHGILVFIIPLKRIIKNLAGFCETNVNLPRMSLSLIPNITLIWFTDERYSSWTRMLQHFWFKSWSLHGLNEETHKRLSAWKRRNHGSKRPKWGITQKIKFQTEGLEWWTHFGAGCYPILTMISITVLTRQSYTSVSEYKKKKIQVLTKYMSIG